MSIIWLTYAWVDNESNDVDYVAQELISEGLEVRLDRWNLSAGRRLWEQIEHFIQNPDESNAWMIYATQNSLGSEACKEEYAYALDRALSSRGNRFPIIGLFPSTVDNSLIPAGIRTRLYVSLTDPDWKERVTAAVEGRDLDIQTTLIEPYYITLHELPEVIDGRRFAIEVRPRGGTWTRFIIGVPINERGRVNPAIMHGPSGSLPNAGILFFSSEGISDDGNYWCMKAQNEATPTQSYFLYCNEHPSMIAFGDENNQPLKIVNIPLLLPNWNLYTAPH